jgi:HEAT repeat protein
MGNSMLRAKKGFLIVSSAVLFASAVYGCEPPLQTAESDATSKTTREDTPPHPPSKRHDVTQQANAEIIKREIEGLSHPNVHTRRNSASNLASFGPAAKGAVDELICALSDKSDADLRMYAARALGAIGPDAHQSVPALRRALSDRDDFGSRLVRTEAAKALGRIGPEAAGVAVDDLLPLLADEDLYVRRAASESLGQLGEKAIPGLIRSLERENPEVRYRATTALARMRDAARSPLEQALKSEDVRVRRGAARAFASYYVAPQIKAVPKLIEHLRDEDPTVCIWIAAALAGCVADSEDAMSALLGALKKDDDFAFEVVVALSRTANREEVLHELLGVLDSQPPLVRAQVIRAVGLAYLDSQAVAKVVPALQGELKNPEVALRAAEALFRLARGNDEVKRQLDAYFARHKLDGPYPGYRDDVRLAVRNMDYEGPEYNFSTPEAIAAARRVFSNVEFVGKSEQEVVAILGDPKALSVYARARYDAPEGKLVYCYATGYGGVEYKLNFRDGRVDSVEGGRSTERRTDDVNVRTEDAVRTRVNKPPL